MIRVRDGEHESVLSIDDFENRARRGEISPHVLVSIPALTGDRFVEAREVPLFAAVYDPRRMLFRRHFRLGRLPLLTGLLGVVCVGLWLWSRHLGGGVVTRETLLLLGAKARSRIVDEGEAWRLLTANLLHRDGMHLGFNLFAFFNIGTVLEGVYRRGDYLLLLVITGISTMALSSVASAPVTVGASGMIFGCLGAAVVFGLRFADVLPLRYRIYFGVVVVGYTAGMFFLGLLRASTDNWGHAGGLVAGVVMGALLEPRLMRLKEAHESHRYTVRPYLLSVAIVMGVIALGPALPSVFVSLVPARFHAFGVELEHPSTWAKGEDVLGLLAFDNGVDAVVSLACGRLGAPASLDKAMRRFIDYELTEEEASGRIAGLRVGTPAEATLGPVAAAIPARRVAFSFTASDGPYDGIAWVLARGEIECEFVTRHRTGASPRAVALLDELSRRVRVVPTVAQMQAAAATRFRPDSVKAWLELALANQTAGATKEARSAFARATALLVQEPSFAGRVHVGTARFELSFGGNVDAALRAAEAAVAAAPDDPDASVVLLDSLVAEHDLARAAGVLAVARGRFPDDARIQAWVLPQAAAP